MSNHSSSTEISPLVSTEWLASKTGYSKLVILDIREGEEYASGHIPGAINIPFEVWVTTKNDLFLELPEAEDLFNVIGNAGIKSDSVIVVVHKTGHPHPLADAARVAITLIYTGLKNIGILDGGYNKWIKENREVSTDIIMPNPVEYRGEINNNIFVTKDYIQSKIGKSVIVDARTPEVYFGLTTIPFGEKLSFNEGPGHIPTAKCLPSPWIWDEDGTYRSPGVLGEMARSIVGEDKSGEIIIYCGVGGNTSAWWYVLTQVLGYSNVRFYDGSAQEWTRDPHAPLVKYIWE